MSSIDGRKGTLHAANAVLTTIMAGMPAKIASANAGDSITLQAMRAAPYVFATDAKLKLTVKTSATPAELELDIPAGSYSAAELAAALNAIPAFSSADLEAGTRFHGAVLTIYSTERGKAGSTTVHNASANEVMGWYSAQEFRHYPLEILEWARCGSVDDVPPAPRAIVVEVENQDVDGDENEYTIVARVFTRSLAYSAGLSHEAMRLALEYGQIVKEIIEESPSLMTASDGHEVQSVTPGFAMSAENNIQGFCDVTVLVNVEEE